MSRLMFVSSNRDKFREVRRILGAMNIKTSYQWAALSEIQSDSLEEIALSKVAAAKDVIGGAILVEDAGLFIESLNGFPGPYSSYVFDTIGNAGILALVRGDRRAYFRSVIAYADDWEIEVFKGEVRGRIADAEHGSGWGYDPIFVPDGSDRTLAQTDKDAFSHRRMALASFAKWYHGMQGSTPASTAG